MVWRARGDGDCFYRCESLQERRCLPGRASTLIHALLSTSAFMLAYFCRIMYAESPELEANLSFSNLQAAMPLLAAANYDMELVSFVLVVSEKTLWATHLQVLLLTHCSRLTTFSNR